MSAEEEHHEPPLSIIRNGRTYTRFAVARDGSGLYRSEQWRGRDFWLVRPNGSDRPWNYRTQFGRKRPLPPPIGRWQRLR